jgi:hypothetical protein
MKFWWLRLALVVPRNLSEQEPMRSHLQRHRLFVLLALVFLCVHVGAQAPSTPTNVTVNAKPATPTISSLSVSSGAVGATVVITGTGFAATQGSGTVTFNGTAATASVWGSLSITVTVPTGATTGNIVVTQSGLASAGAAFTVTGGCPSGVVCISPGTNIQSVIDANPAGTTYLLLTGTHRMQTITPKTGDTYKGELSGTTKLSSLNGSRELTGWTTDGPTRWYVTGQTQQGTLGNAEDCTAAYPMCIYPEDLFYNDTLQAHVATLAELGVGEWYFDYTADRIYVGTDPTSASIETSVTPAVFLPSSADTVTVRDLIVEQYASVSTALNLGYSPGGAETWVADNIEARWNNYGGIGLDTNTTVRNSYMHHNGNNGFVCAGTNVLVEDNEIAWNGIAAGFDDISVPAGFNPYWGSGGSKCVFTDGLIVRDNYAHHNYGPGLWTDINNVNCLYQNNISSDNWRSGIYHEISYACEFDGNTLERNGGDTQWGNLLTNCGIEILSSPNADIHDNIVTDNHHGICIRDDERDTGNQGSLDVVNTVVTSNTITQASSGTGGLTGFQDGEGNGYDGDGNVFTLNIYCLSGSDTAFFSWDGSDTLTQAQWQATGNDTAGDFNCGLNPSCTATVSTQAQLTSAVTAASSDGTAVICVSGTLNISSLVTISKALHLRGATNCAVNADGVPVTTDTYTSATSSCADAISFSGTGVPIFLWFDLVAGKATRLSNLRLWMNGGSASYIVGVFGAGNTGSFRWDHTFVGDAVTLKAHDSSGPLLFDHNFSAFTGTNRWLTIHTKWSGSTTMTDDEWTVAANAARTDQAFIEDNVLGKIMNDTTGARGHYAVVDGWGSTDITFRHNKVYNGWVEVHGQDSSARVAGARSLTVHDNLFYGSNVFAGGGFGSAYDCVTACNYMVNYRSGQPITFNNTTDVIDGTGYPSGTFIELAAYRYMSGAYAPFGNCNGSNQWDRNSGGVVLWCLRQPTRGAGSLITGDPLNAPPWASGQNDQISEPGYEWNNVRAEGGAITFSLGGGVYTANVDYFTPTAGTSVPGSCSTLNQGYYHTGTRVLYWCHNASTYSIHTTFPAYPHALNN